MRAPRAGFAFRLLYCSDRELRGKLAFRRCRRSRARARYGGLVNGNSKWNRVSTAFCAVEGFRKGHRQIPAHATNFRTYDDPAEPFVVASISRNKPIST